LTKKILVINGHPDPRPERYCHALCDAYVRGALSSGLETRRLNVGSLDFPFLNSAEPDLSGTQTELARAIEAIHWATQFAIVFPLWLDAPPPALRELLERANRPGPKFEPLVEHAANDERIACVIVTMAMPAFTHRPKFNFDGCTPNDSCSIALPGIKTQDTTFIGSVEEITNEQRLRWLNTIYTFGMHADKIRASRSRARSQFAAAPSIP
jgi:putative NADPH-quinone reductase